MRIRSIKPEFWRSDDIAALDWDVRLLFIGLWSYVDDNGVGFDKLSSITADLFAPDLADNPHDTLATVSRGLQTLSEAGLITRYHVADRPLLHITTWAKHQRIDKPAKARYEPPTCDDAVLRDTLATPSRGSGDISTPGAEEQGNRGAEEQALSSSAPQSDVRDLKAPERFDDFYSLYPRKESRGQAVKAWRAAIKKADPDTIIDGLKAQLSSLRMKERQFQPLPSTWLNGERWDDDLTEQAKPLDQRPEGWR